MRLTEEGGWLLPPTCDERRFMRTRVRAAAAEAAHRQASTAREQHREDRAKEMLAIASATSSLDMFRNKREGQLLRAHLKKRIAEKAAAERLRGGGTGSAGGDGQGAELSDEDRFGRFRPP